MKKKIERHFDIRIQGTSLSITTDRNRLGTLGDILKIIVHECYKKKPEELERLIKSINDWYCLVTQDSQADKPEPLDNFEFWKGLMERKG